MFPPIALGVIMATLDISVVNIALPTLQRRFASPFVTVEWVALAYSLTITALLLSAGRLADVRGRRAVYSWGLALFTVASLACGLAPGVHALIALRVLQGVGAAMVAANGSALLVAAFPESERGRALGAFGAMVGIGLAVGPPLGGLMVAHASWRWIFLVNVPLGLFAFFLARARLPRDLPRSDLPVVDGGPTALWAGGLAALMLALSRGPANGWASPLVFALLVAGAVLLAWFVASQAVARAPLLPLDMLTGPLGAAVTLTFASQLISGAVGLHMPLLLEEVTGASAATSGRWLAIVPLAALVAAPIAGRLADRLGARPLTVTGLAMTAAGLWTLAQLEVGIAPLPMLAGLVMVGLGLGLFSVPNASALLSLVPPEQLGLASGLQGTMRNLGLASGLAITGAIVASRYAAHGGGALHLTAATRVVPAAFVAATRELFLTLAACAVAATLLAWRTSSARKARVRA